MAGKKSRREYRNKHSMLKLALSVFIVFMAVQIAQSWYKINKKTAQIEILDQKIAAQTLKNNEMERLIAEGSNDEYIERVAREKLGLVMPGESVYINILGD